jgi:ubiquitin-protein ligase
MSSAATRLSKELAEVGKDDKTSGVKAVPVNPDNPRVLKGTIKGPEGTPYEGGIFQINITIPKQYPFEPPKMNFHTKIWHPNISSQTGAICLVRLHGLITTTGPYCYAHMRILTTDMIVLDYITPLSLSRPFCSFDGTLPTGYSEGSMVPGSYH